MRREYVGLPVETTMGVYQRGTIIDPIPRHAYTDGSYRSPMTMELRSIFYVRWEDGTQGWTHKQFIVIL